jgi:class 3 adenylate cyclase
LKTKILVIDDDPGIRKSLSLSLRTEGYAVVLAASGREALEVAAREIPALIICDVNMPEMDGYEVVRQLRQSAALVSVPFIFLTARGERADIRRGMNLGADDYLTKPFTREELIDAVRVRLKRLDESREALAQQLILDSERMRSRFVSRLTAGANAAIDDTAPQDTVHSIIEATVLFTDIRSFTTISERLSVGEIATLLNQYFQRACEPILAAGGKVVKFIGDGIMAVFPHGDGQPRERQALRAIQAGLALSLAAHQFREWMQARFAERGLPEFAIGVGIHTGEVTLFPVGAQGEENFTAIGDTVNIASRLEGQTKELGWPVVASGAAISAAGEAVRYGAHRVVHLRGRSKPVLVYEVLGLKGLVAPPAAKPDDLSRQLQQALAGNAEGAALAAKAALRDALLALLASGPTLSSPQHIKNYAVIAKLGDPNRSSLYLAERDTDGQKVAIRIRQRRPGDDAFFQRFVDRATTIGRIRHRHVAAIFDHGFADDVAYIVTEHFPRGSVKQALSFPLPAPQALALLWQAATGLREVHRLCTLAEDIDPDNLMLRADGDVVLSELDCRENAPVPVDAGARPYRAPERLAGQSGDVRADIYSLGIIFHEMLTGQIPSAAAAKLEPPLAAYEALLAGMLAQNPASRYVSCDALISAIERCAAHPRPT